MMVVRNWLNANHDGGDPAKRPYQLRGATDIAQTLQFCKVSVEMSDHTTFR